MQETAQDLANLGVIDDRRMKAHGLLNIPPVKAFSDAPIRALRKRLNVSQAVLAVVLNTSKSTIQKWKVGDKSPSGPSLKLLNIIDRKGLAAVI
ncbi:MAG: helix-turn-helix domain-containing protein [Burkholderiales bacterium]|nr:helix-turn-helix domain-containing protein [Burkholderiales bacterium]